MRAVPPRAAAPDPAPYAAAEAAFAEAKAYLSSREAQQMSESDLERELHRRGQALMRKLLQGHLDQRSPGEAAGGRGGRRCERSQRRVHQRHIETTFGTSRAPGLRARSLAVCIPRRRAEPAAGALLAEVRRRVAEAAASRSFDEALFDLSRSTGAEVPKRQAEQLVVRAARTSRLLRRAPCGDGEPPPEGSVVVLTFDGKGVVLHRDDLREATRRAAEKRRQQREPLSPFKRLKPGEKKAAEAAFAEAKAYLEREPWEVVAEATLEAERQDPEHVKRWVVLVDGAETQLDMVEASAAAYGVDVTVILDIIHVVEYVWKAAHVFHREQSPELGCWVWTRVRSILEGKSSKVAAAMRRAATVAGLSKDTRKPVDTCADYLQKYAPYLHYDRYLAAGYPIATGVIEGACRYLIRDRMELTGARWRLVGAEAVLKLRALRASGDFDAYWDFHEARQYERNHAQRYIDGTAPPVTEPPPPPSPPRLRRVK